MRLLACIPSKTLLRPPEAKVGADRAQGVAGAALDWPATRAYRDFMIRNLDDSNQVKGYRNSGAAVFKGQARIVGPGRVQVSGEELSCDHVVVATGSDAFVPPVEGLDAVPVWTNRQATTVADIPRRAVMIGGSAVGVELGLFLRRYGAAVTILERSGRLLSREERRVGELTEQYLRDEGVDVRTGTSAARARRDGDDTVVELDSGEQVRCDSTVSSEIGGARATSPREDESRRAGRSPLAARRRRMRGSLILPLGAWVLRHACADFMRWRTLHPGAPGQLAVNVSAHQIMGPAFALTVARVLRDTNMDPRCLLLEVTESVFLDDADRASAVISELKALGVQLALDEFGTGYSCLSYLSRFPFNTKISGDFVADLTGDDPTPRAVVECIVGLGRALGLTVVAEGIETPQQLSTVATLGADLAQGHHLSHPLAPADLEQHILGRTAVHPSHSIAAPAGPAGPATSA